MAIEKLKEPGSGRQPTPTKRKGDETMKKYKVEKRTANKHQLWDRRYFETLDEAEEYVFDERFEDLKYGEIDDYEYEIIDLNKQGGTK